MKSILVKIPENDISIATKLPIYEVKKAKKICDEVASGVFKDVVVVHTVSTDAVGTYWNYGKEILGLDVKLSLNDKVIDIEKAFEFFNDSYELLDSLTH